MYPPMPSGDNTRSTYLNVQNSGMYPPMPGSDITGSTYLSGVNPGAGLSEPGTDYHYTLNRFLAEGPGDGAVVLYSRCPTLNPSWTIGYSGNISPPRHRPRPQAPTIRPHPRPAFPQEKIVEASTISGNQGSAGLEGHSSEDGQRGSVHEYALHPILSPDPILPTTSLDKIEAVPSPALPELRPSSGEINEKILLPQGEIWAVPSPGFPEPRSPSEKVNDQISVTGSMIAAKPSEVSLSPHPSQAQHVSPKIVSWGWYLRIVDLENTPQDTIYQLVIQITLDPEVRILKFKGLPHKPGSNNPGLTFSTIINLKPPAAYASISTATYGNERLHGNHSCDNGIRQASDRLPSQSRSTGLAQNPNGKHSRSNSNDAGSGGGGHNPPPKKTKPQPDPQFGCLYCKEIFESWRKMIDHILRVHIKHLQCDECDKRYGKSWELTRHKRGPCPRWIRYPDLVPRQVKVFARDVGTCKEDYEELFDILFVRGKKRYDAAEDIYGVVLPQPAEDMPSAGVLAVLRLITDNEPQLLERGRNDMFSLINTEQPSPPQESQEGLGPDADSVTATEISPSDTPPHLTLSLPLSPPPPPPPLQQQQGGSQERPIAELEPTEASALTALIFAGEESGTPLESHMDNGHDIFGLFDFDLFDLIQAGGVSTTWGEDEDMRLDPRFIYGRRTIPESPEPASLAPPELGAVPGDDEGMPSDPSSMCGV